MVCGEKIPLAPKAFCAATVLPKVVLVADENQAPEVGAIIISRTFNKGGLK
jgi:hypothetical protein